MFIYTEVSRDKQIIAAEENSREKDFWKMKISGEPVISRFPSRKAGGRGEPGPFETLAFRLEGPLYRELMKLSTGTDHKLHIILVSVVALLMAQYAGEDSIANDVLIVSPIYRPGIEGELINTLLPLRIPRNPGMTFRDILKGTSRALIEAMEHQNFPVGVLFQSFGESGGEPGAVNPQVAVLLENIHEPRHIRCMNPAVTFHFHRSGEGIDGKLTYNGTIHEKAKAESIPDYWRRLLETVTAKPDVPVSGFNVIPGGEKKMNPLETGEDPGKAGMVFAPMNKVEEKLAGIWAEVLELDKNEIGSESNFFQLNGNSLRTIMLISRIFKEFEVRVALADVFRYPNLRELARHLDGATGQKYKAIELAKEKEYYVLSSAQERLFFLQQWDEKSDVYNVPDIVEWNSPLDLERLRKVARAMIDRHESFRTSFEILDDHPMQKVHPPGKVEFEIHSYEAGAGGVEGIMKDFVRPFDLRQPPLLRIGVVRDGERRYLVYDMHHIITDAFSKGIFFNDFLKLYEGEELPPLKLQYKDYAEWQNSQSQKEAMNRQETYWLDLFSGDLPALRLPTDFNRPPIPTFEGSTVTFRMEPGELEALYRLTQSENVTIFMALLGIYTVMLSKIAGQEDVIIGTVIAGRSHADLEEIVGMFVNTLALRNFPHPEKTFSDYLNDVKTITLEAFENQDYQFEDLVDKLTLERDISRHSLFDVLLVVGNIDLRTKEKGREALPVIKQKSVGYQNKTSKFDMALFYHETEEIFEWEYSTRLFKEETIKEFFDYFKEVAGMVTRDPYIKIKDIAVSHRLKESSAELPPMEFEF